MGTVRGKIFGMKAGIENGRWTMTRFQRALKRIFIFNLPLFSIFILFAIFAHAQQMPVQVKHATSFSSNMYFEPPNERKVKMKLAGAEAAPLPGGLLDVKNLSVEIFNTNGVCEVSALAPQCTYALLDGVANSSGRMKMLSGDGKISVSGEGFLFVCRPDATSLILSNHVHT